MTKLKNYVGIDISKNWLDVAVLKKQNVAASVVLEERYDNEVNGPQL